MRFIEGIRHRTFAWLAKELDSQKERNPGAQNCKLGIGARLLPEAEINNNSGNPEHISIGENSHIRGRLLTYGHGGHISIGNWCYVGVRSEIWSMESVSLGNRVLIAHDVNIHDGTAHSADPLERHEHFRHIVEKGHPRTKLEIPGVLSAPVVIGDDVWISFGVSILRGVRIGKGSVIAAGSVVMQDVPPGFLYRCRVSPVLVPLTEQDFSAELR